ncbi:MAG: penicillin-binding protein 2 [Chloroflexi bacterium]|nr:penicillin-binding protein 2 [Chloroflexota bacterium]
MDTNWYIKSRYLVFRVLVIGAFALIGFKLWNLQIQASESFQKQADVNRFRLVQVDAPRGIIYDQKGRLLVRNVPSFTVFITPGALPTDRSERRKVLERVGEYLGMRVEAPELDAVLYSGQGDSLQPIAVEPKHEYSIEELLNLRYSGEWTAIAIKTNVPRELAFEMDQDQLALLGVSVVATPIREYLEGPLMGQIIGYEGRIPADALADYQADTEAKYLPGDLVGLAGIEATQERWLRGAVGQKHIEVDAYEREVAVLAEQAPVPGYNIRLTIDTEYQRAVEEILRAGMKNANTEVGVAIAMDPRDGRLLALVTLPTYDNNLFSGGISYDDFNRLSTDPNHPLINHAISGQYPPGSTFKVIPAVAALQEGIISLGSTVTCHGTMRVPNKYYPDNPALEQTFYCWAQWGHGPVNVTTALMGSCDIFFYVVTGGNEALGVNGLGIKTYDEYMKLFGFGERTGVELVGEYKGLVPDPRWKIQNYSESWALGDTYNAAIGQGFVLVTPLQLVNAISAIANGGTLYKPQIVEEITDADGNVVRPFKAEVIREIPVDPEILAYIRSALRETITDGTASRADIPGVTIAGKTGSAEYAVWDENGNLIRDEHGALLTHSWFVAFAPYDEPEIAVVVFLQGGGTGAYTAAPVAGNIIRQYYGIELGPLTSPSGQLLD